MSLKILSLKNVLTSLSQEDQIELLDQLNYSEIHTLQDNIKHVCCKYNQPIYIGLFQSEHPFSKEIYEFFKVQSPQRHGWIPDNMSRRDPVLILTAALLNIPSVEVYRLPVLAEEDVCHIHKQYYGRTRTYREAYEIVKADSDYGNEYTTVTAISSFAYGHRPIFLFRDICDFAQKHNITVNLEAVKDFPKDGPYRVFD